MYRDLMFFVLLFRLQKEKRQTDRQEKKGERFIVPRSTIVHDQEFTLTPQILIWKMRQYPPGTLPALAGSWEASDEPCPRVFSCHPENWCQTAAALPFQRSDITQGTAPVVLSF